jgi:hypothetical protein
VFNKINRAKFFSKCQFWKIVYIFNQQHLLVLHLNRKVLWSSRTLMFSITPFSELMQCNKTVDKPNNRNYWNFTAHYRVTTLGFRTIGAGWWLMEPGQWLCAIKTQSLHQTWGKCFDVSVKSLSPALKHTLLLISWSTHA